MGNSLDKLGGYGSQEDSEDSPSYSRTRKRKKQPDSVQDSPTKIAKLDTPKYVYERLFLQGEGSDIRINALGNSWNLHRIYLQQCDYFEVLLGGQWEDSQNAELSIEIPDENVTAEGLQTVFGALYNNEIQYKVDNAIAIIAAASFFKHERILERCDEELVEEITEANIIRFLNVARMYGLKSLKTECMSRLKGNFWRLMRNFELLKQLDKDDFLNMLSSTDLLVIEGEYDLYKMVKNWIYLKNSKSFTFIDEESLGKEVKKFLQKVDTNQLFIENRDLFAALRLHHLVTSTASIAELEEDGLVPKEILKLLMVDQWKTTLLNEEQPSSSAGISDESFYLNCLRGGRRVESSPKCWRWTGFNYGMDLVVNCNRGIITLKRNCFHTATPYSVNLKSERVVHYRLIICDGKGKSLHDSGKKELTLHLDQSSVVCCLPEEVSLPISVHLFYLAAMPPSPSLLYINQYVRHRLALEEVE